MASQARAAVFLEDEKDILSPAPLCALELALAATVASLVGDLSQRWRDLTEALNPLLHFLSVIIWKPVP